MSGDDDTDRQGILVKPFLGTVDERAYAAFRIGFAVVALINVVILWPYREMFFVEGGMIDREAVLGEGFQTRLSVFQWVSSVGGVTVVFFVAAAAIIGLGLGVAVRFCAVIVFIWPVCAKR